MTSEPVIEEGAGGDKIFVSTDLANTDIEDTDLADTDIVDKDLVDTDLVDTDLADTDIADNARERPYETLYLELSPTTVEYNTAPVPSLVETCGLCDLSADQPNEYSQLMNYCVHEEELLPHNCLGQQTKLDQLVAKKTANTSRTWKAGVPFILFLIVCCLVFIFCRDHLEDFLNWLDALPRWQSGIIFVVLFTIISLPGAFGYLILNIAAGYMYGFWLGMLIIFIAVTVGSIIAFVLVRRCLPGCVDRLLSTDGDDAALINPMLRIIEGKNGVKVIALFRLTPVPFGFQNGVFALTDISIFKYTFATCIGLLPTQALNTYFGTTLRSIKDVVSNDGESYILFSFQLLISLVLMIFVARLARQEINKCSELSGADKGDLESGEGFKKGHSRSKSASAILMSKQKIINQPSIFK